ncbi:exodeoxyribonuclease VII large subunit [Alkalilimnicola sp. S0819]|uniref:exodeoxyribonuclease VII large subunit n=1 Tax=Alkalilimnicola sp. S0819 TaxID=2613922 RepID=UPI001261AFCE|nr:exodeoxyribonuclease VII large subunit [Alkalilimnicola sp. S0819]MPQ15615.1 exodeoxyribonuclease VII large subunit [Alkalilimnicola sp. S0819]
MQSPNPDQRPDIYTVTRLNEEARALLETGLPLLWVEGEISNLARPASGHIYFTLKDSGAQVRCAMFRGRNQLLRFAPRNGERVLLRAKVSLYPARGDYQLIVEHMESAGDGALRRAFEQLQARLQAEGLFDPAHKRPLPAMPQRLGVITSPSGAAIRDVLSVLKRRYPRLEVLIYPVPVQGEGAARQIAEAIALADARREVDLLLLTRGGGSLEDLWAFNEEDVARALYACELPTVSAVGHEVDYSIADLVADQRAATPSAAAELISPDGAAWLRRFVQLEQQLRNLQRRQRQRQHERLQWLTHRLRQLHPGRRLQDHGQRLDELEQRLRRALQLQLSGLHQRLAGLNERLGGCSPAERIGHARERLQALARRQQRQMQQELHQRRLRLRGLAGELNAISPLATLQRGYAIVHDAEGGVLRRAAQARSGDAVVARLSDGSLHCVVGSVRLNEPGEQD